MLLSDRATRASGFSRQIDLCCVDATISYVTTVTMKTETEDDDDFRWHKYVQYV